MTIDVFIKLTDDGADILSQFFTGAISNRSLYYFKLGEGGWTQSALFTDIVAVGDDTASYSGTLSFLPVVQGSLTIIAGAQTVTDTPNSPYDGTGTLTGNGTGTINYKTGEFSVTFSSAVALGTNISGSHRYWGSLSEVKTKVVGNGDGTIGPYTTTLEYRAEDAPIGIGTVTVSDGGSTPQELTDTPSAPYDGTGTLTGDGSGSIDYETGELDWTFTAVVPSSQEISVDYQYTGAPDQPDKTLTDLISESDPELHTFKKYFTINTATPTDGDIWEVDGSPGRLRAKAFAELYEAIDDGNGYPPAFFEGGLFLEDDTMLAHFTYTKARKFGSTEIQFLLDQVL